MLQIDIFGEIQAAPQSHRFLVVVHDLHSKWPEIAATSSVTSATVIALLEKLFTRWGLPKTIISDNGPQFTSDEFNRYLASLGIEHRCTTRYNPQSNGGVERFNRVIKEGLKAHRTEGKSIENALQSILRTYRGTPHSLTGKTPAELMIGRNLRYPLNILKPPENPPQHVANNAKLIAERQDKAKCYTDRKRRAQVREFKPGNWVRVKRPQQGHKLMPTLSSPRRVSRRLGPHSYELDDGSRWNARRLVHSYQGGIEKDNRDEGIDLAIQADNPGVLNGHDQEQPPAIPTRRSQRVKTRPGYLNDYVC